MRRTFPPGSEWLYAKLYAAPSMGDRLLREVVHPLVDRALGSGAAHGWFFIRYADPDSHLRLRFRGDPARLRAEVLPLIERSVAPLLERGEVRRFQLDTYERELERYGGAVAMPLCEAVFQADSEAVLEVVEAFDDDALAEARWKLAVPGMDLLLEGLGLDPEQKLAVLRTVRDGFAREHRADQKLLRQIGDRFRTERASLEAALDRKDGADGPLARGAVPLSRQAERLAPVMADLRRAAERGDLTLPPVDLAPSFRHMHANRLLRSDHRRQELILYDFLCRLYDSRAARARVVQRPAP